ncbi:MAG: hypothetical protein M3464_20230 [Chloroflexota bacterium]|nr:hypothetical protein [Chloroflexota bacterium]
MVAKPEYEQASDDIVGEEIVPGVFKLNREEGRVEFDRQARMELGISGEEFLRRWDNGEYQPIPDTPDGWKVGRLYMLMPLVLATKF